MLYFSCALYAEAKPMIDYYQLKKEAQQTKYQIFSSQEVKLVISGPGAFDSAIATTYLLSQTRRCPDDIIINVGICGAVSHQHPLGTPVLIHKITEHHSRHTYYPEISIPHSLEEGSLETFSEPVNREQAERVRGEYVDMEAAGFFKAAATFIPLQNIGVYKIISDYLLSQAVDHALIEEISGHSFPALLRIIQHYRQIQEAPVRLISKEEDDLLHHVSLHLRLSSTMQHELQRLAKQAKLSQQMELFFLNNYLQVEIGSKQEGKKIFEKIKQKLIYS